MTTSHRLTITTGSATDAQARFARDALRSQRARLPDLFRDFEDETWTGTTRCEEWSVHQVVRHLSDATLALLALLRGDSLESVGLGIGEGFDPRTTPVEWLGRSAGEGPAQSVGVFEQASAELVDEVDRLTEHNGADQLPFPLGGTAPWSVLTIHLVWDAWVHERDILAPLGRRHESPELESRAAAIHGLVLSGVPFMLGRTPHEETIVLDGDGGGVFRLEARDGTATVRVGVDTDPGDALRGALPDVVDSLIGRGPDPTEVLHGPAERVNPLGMLRRFMLSPAA